MKSFEAGASVIIGSQKTQIYQWFSGSRQEVFSPIESYFIDLIAFLISLIKKARRFPFFVFLNPKSFLISFIIFSNNKRFFWANSGFVPFSRNFTHLFTTLEEPQRVICFENCDKSSNICASV